MSEMNWLGQLLLHYIYALINYTSIYLLPWPVPSPDEKGGGFGVMLAPPPHKDFPATETTTKELFSPGRSCEADHDNGFMTAGYQGRDDVSSSIAYLLTPKRRTRV